MHGYAADFVCPSFGAPIAIARKLDASGLAFDQCIAEGNWIHISFAPRMLRETLTALKGPLGNTPAFRRKIQDLLADNAKRDQLMKELGLGDDKAGG